MQPNKFPAEWMEGWKSGRNLKQWRSVLRKSLRFSQQAAAHLGITILLTRESVRKHIAMPLRIETKSPNWLIPTGKCSRLALSLDGIGEDGKDFFANVVAISLSQVYYK